MGSVVPILDGARPALLAPVKQNLNLFLSAMVWLNTGWDSMGNLASDVATPKDMFVGMSLAAVTAMLVNLMCTVAALAAGAGSWSDGYLAVAFGRYWMALRPWITACAGLANLVC